MGLERTVMQSRIRIMQERDAAIARAEAAERELAAAQERADQAERKAFELQVKVTELFEACAEQVDITEEVGDELVAAQERLRAMEWRPIAEYDREAPMLTAFCTVMNGLVRSSNLREATHFAYLQLPQIPEGE